MDNSGVLTGKLENLANWVAMSVASAFFISLERCSCVNLSTSDSDDEAEEEANDRPLMFTNQKSINGRSSVDTLPV